MIQLTLYQTQPVGDKVVRRELRAGIYDGKGNCISEEKDFIFDSRSENAREREQGCRLNLGNAANALSNQTVELRLYEKIPGTKQYQPEPYKVIPYTLRRSFEKDFDF